ncbi:MAG: sugar ABC transporter substrate-binding protein [Chloroflexi bacterium]|uniref:Sugar ABC transporter substrate-binding protein n=1 Tax=Candidatus Chlorohelix allophototropha TaxID=3003348 RepID=A0A8T7LWG3_9CHLR|nr:sugar ABC transporter substrate-binding protein [Chloroflexota bacterium]WJW67085.1 sugar ABC transporter substrate-binding protein [Chloroflexota bacterium L227-S17]
MNKKEQHFNKCFALLSFLLVNLLLIACGEETAKPTSAINTPALGGGTSATSATKNVSLTFSYWGDEAEIQIDKKLIDLYERLHPGIKIISLYEKWENYFNRVEQDWIGDKAPDVMFLSYIPNYASKGILESLQPYIAKEKELDLNDFYPNLLEAFHYNNALYGLPRDNDTKVIYVNLRMFREAGLATPKAGWTLQDLREAAKKLTKRDENGNITQYGFAFEPDYWWQLYVWQLGGEVYDSFTSPEPPSKLLLNSPEALSGIHFYSDLINKDRVTPTYEQMNTSTEITQLFQDGKLAMAFGGHGKVPAFSQTPGLEWDVVPLPVGKQRVNVAGGAGYVIHKNSKNKAEAWELVKFLTGDLGEGLFMETGLLTPARQSIREDNIYLRNSKYNWQVFNEESKYGKRVAQFRSSNDVVKLIDTELESVWRGQKSPVEILSGLPAKIDPVLAKLKV